MPARIISPVIQNTVLRQMDFSLRPYFGRGPDSRIDADLYMANFWAWDPWPLRSGMVSDGLAAGNYPMSNRCVWVEDIRWSGISSYLYHIAGTVKDNTGLPVGSATVKLYRTSDDAWMFTITSQDDGTYSFGVTDTTTQYYVVGYRTAPAIAGTTVNTLVGS